MILAIDTATRWLGLALYDGSSLLAEIGWKSINTQTIDLTPAIDDLFKRIDGNIADLKGIAIAIGPGSYTGLRVGLGVAKGLSLAYKIPLIGVDTLDIVATAFGPMEGQLCVVAEAGRTRIVAALYGWNKRHSWRSKGKPVISTWGELLGELEMATTFAGEITPEAKKQIRAHKEHTFRVASPVVSARRAGYLAELAWKRLRKGQVDDASALTPNYLREPAGS